MGPVYAADSDCPRLPPPTAVPSILTTLMAIAVGSDSELVKEKLHAAVKKENKAGQTGFEKSGMPCLATQPRVLHACRHATHFLRGTSTAPSGDLGLPSAWIIVASQSLAHLHHYLAGFCNPPTDLPVIKGFNRVYLTGHCDHSHRWWLYDVQATRIWRLIERSR
jgi:hypothetical protein